MCQFKSIRKKPCPNDPVPVYLHVLDHDKMELVPPATTDEGNGIYNTVQSDVTLKAGLADGDKWQPLEFRQRSADFVLEGKGEQDSNQYKEQKLTAFYPESDEEAMYKLGMVAGWEGFVSFKNGDGKRILWGTLENRVLLTKADFTASKGGWDLEFMRTASASEGSPPFYTGAIAE
ncbi:MAG: hypothetical protein AAFX78_14700 [Cyanobacteria bacterium J06638_20]